MDLKYEDVKYLTVALPEPVENLRNSGNFHEEKALICEYLADEDTIYPMRCRLKLELNSIDVIKNCYTLSEDELLSQIREEIPDFAVEELNRYRRENKVDWFFIEGEVKYIRSAKNTLMKVYPEFYNQSKSGDNGDYSAIDEIVEDIRDGQNMSAYIHLKQRLKITDIQAGSGRILRVHMPMPTENKQISDLKIISVSPGVVKYPSMGEAQPTIYFEFPEYVNDVIEIEYKLIHSLDYKDMSKVNISDVKKEKIPEEIMKYLEEKAPHICFTPYLRFLAEEIKGDETNLLIVARKIYDYITTNVKYRFVRDYSSIDNISEYCAINRRGDCGVQALLFITLCRICGIPAGWQSGLDAKPGDIGQHDWAVFYIPSVGWRHADPSYGGSAYVRNDTARWNFFFGNADPYRIPINSEFQEDFVPAKKYWRFDPYDNQTGEAEFEDRGVKGPDLNYEFECVDIYLIK